MTEIGCVFAALFIGVLLVPCAAPVARTAVSGHIVVPSRPQRDNDNDPSGRSIIAPAPHRTLPAHAGCAVADASDCRVADHGSGNGDRCDDSDQFPPHARRLLDGDQPLSRSRRSHSGAGDCHADGGVYPGWSRGGTGAGTVVVVNAGTGTVRVVDEGSARVLTTITLGGGSGWRRARSGAPRPVRLRERRQSVAVVNTTSNRVVATVPVGPGPDGIAVDPSDGRVFVANVGDGTVSEIDAPETTSSQRSRLASILRQLPSIRRPNGCTSRSMTSNTVTVLDRTTNQLIADVTVGNQPDAIAVDAHRNRVYVGNTRRHGLDRRRGHQPEPW